MPEFLSFIFWISFLTVFYTYLGYGIILGMLVQIKRRLSPKVEYPAFQEDWPEVTILIAAYNEKDFIRQKLENTFSLDYPSDKLRIRVVTDGSIDGTDQIAASFPGVNVSHQPKRAGKIGAINRVMPEITSPIVVFTDANTFLNPMAIQYLARHFADPQIGAVAGEKRIMRDFQKAAAGAGEGLYWKYESILKKWDAAFYSVVGAAGELFAIRREAFVKIRPDTIIEDFVLSMRIAAQGYRVGYEPEAFAREAPSVSVREELKRKIRIAAGGLQAVYRLAFLLNPFKFGWLSFQYISHRVLRWTLAPVGLMLMFVTNFPLAIYSGAFYQLFLIGQILFYALALAGHFLQKKHIRIKGFFIPYYFLVMNYAVFAGAIRLLRKKQNVLWERSKRRKVT